MIVDGINTCARINLYNVWDNSDCTIAYNTVCEFETSRIPISE